ncbi:MAG: ATP-binding protein [Thiotrichales bacterium]|nr:ATP-binding protein [Thiotrichales bacterium]
MFRTLYGKLSVALVAIVFAIAALYAALTLFATRHHLQATEQRLNRDLARDLVADRNLVEAGRINESALKGMFHDYMIINPSIEIYLIDLEGKVLSFSADPGVVKRKRISLEPVRAFLSGDTAYPLLGDDPRSHDGRKAFSVTPVPSDENPQGYLYVVLLGERVDSIAALLHTSFIARYSALALIVSVVVGSLAGLVVLRAMTRRLRRLTYHIDRFRAAGFRASEPFTTGGPGNDDGNGDGDGDEIAQLGRTYDEMAARIGEQFDALEKTDALRREMVAHVSHDLRTPLATLHGYLETLKLKDAELDPAERERYLAVALDQSERLRRLVGDLFELAKLDAHEQAPVCEPISLAELASDIAQKFQLEARHRGSTIDIDAADGLPMVDADIALVERVLENLIDNALSHSPDGGAIRIPIAAEGDAVRVMVSDSGPGIAPEHLPRVFDRFYQADNAHRGTAHAGLGLAIAKRIVELHGARLEVESALGRGTTFSFRLPAYAPASPSSAT